MNNISDFISQVVSSDPQTITKLLISALIVILLWLFRRGVLQIVSRRTDDLKTRYNWRKTSAYIFFFAAALFLLPFWIDDASGLTTYLGLVSAGIAIALKDPLTNLAGWVFILWRHPFRIGDRIQIGENAGDVIDVRIFQFSLMEIGNWVESDQSTGRIIHIPNGKVFTLPLANYSHAFNYIWNEIQINITFESDWVDAKRILMEIAERHSMQLNEASGAVTAADDEYLIFYQHLTPTVYTSITERGVRLIIRYLCDPRQRRKTAEAIWEDVLRAFQDQAQIQFAYPTYRYLGGHDLPWSS